MDDIFAKPESYEREIHPAGTFAAVCVDLVDLGMRVKDFQGRRSAAHTCALVFSTGRKSKDGFSLDLQQEFTVSLNGKANLAKFIESWRGKPLTDEEKGSGFSLKAYGHKPAMISVIHRKSKDGSRTYANIGSIMPLPDGMALPDVSGYERAPFWEKRRDEYASQFEAYMTEVPAEEAPF